MKLLLHSLVLIFTSLLAGCKKEECPSAELVGTWQLTNRQCFCVPGPHPNEMVTFTDTDFSFYKENRQTVYGQYILTTGKTCGGSASIPVVRFAYVNANYPPADVAVTVTGNKLVLDYGIACDAPLESYKRLP